MLGGEDLAQFALIYQTLSPTQRHQFDALVADMTLRTIEEPHPWPPSSAQPPAYPGLIRIIRQATEDDPEARPNDAQGSRTP